MINDGSTGAFSANTRVTESAKSLELRKFFAPQGPNNPLVHCALNDNLNKDGALDSYAEAIIWRLRGVHAMVSLIDRGTQYFLAGAMKSRMVDDHGSSDDEVVNDGDWFGCSTVSTPGGLCENTVALDLGNDEYPCFIVNDLSKDDRFAQLPVVDGSVASYRFYAGVPITTQYGVNIGSMFLFDDKPRQGLTLQQRKIIHRQATNVMRHLEMKREAAERRRAVLMSQGIAKFLDRAYGETDLPENPAVHRDGGQEVPYLEANNYSSRSPVISEPAQVSVLDKIRVTLDHAAEILRESLELHSGGVAFLDSTLGYVEDDAIDLLEPRMNRDDKEIETQERERRVLDEIRETHTSNSDAKGAFELFPKMLENNSVSKHKASKVLAISATDAAFLDAESNPLDNKTLQSLTKSYPKGNIWYFDESGYFSSLEQIRLLEETSAVKSLSNKRFRAPTDIKKKTHEGNILSRIFGKARQLIFLPLWDAGGDRWYAGCFIWSMSAVPVFTFESEVAYVSALSNSVMVEISRLDAINSNKIKSDFISSISRQYLFPLVFAFLIKKDEFRSPLHGILAGAEFLKDSSLDVSQRELVSTIQNCGGTLLDTINHVLDYSKINSFDQASDNLGNVGNELFQPTNLALLCEDVIQGMIAANEFRDSNDLNLASVTSEESHALRTTFHSPNHKDLELIIDIENRDWNFKVQPGALRRVVMNIFGNAQKYTEVGYIILQLRILEAAPNAFGDDKSTLFLRIRDTGRGMSSEYMERKLYHPFAQEDAFATGVGLGLSIVWSIVSQLGGKIRIQSDLGKGTDVEITIPVEKATGYLAAISTPGDLSRISTEAEQAIRVLQERAAGKSVLMSRRKPSDPGKNMRDISWATIKKYCSDWYGFKVLTSSNEEGGPAESSIPDLVITDDLEHSPASDQREHTDSLKQACFQRVLILHDQMLSLAKSDYMTSHRLVGYICHPIGPFKLARCILSLLDQQMSPHSTNELNQSNASTQTPLASPNETAPGHKTSLAEYGFLPSVTIENTVVSKSAKRLAIEAESALSILSPSSQETSDDEALTVLHKSRSTTSVRLSHSSENRSTQIPSGNSLTAQTTVATSPSAVASLPLSASSAETQNTSLHILAVDDNALNLQLLRRYLSRYKLDVIVTARDGFEAVAAVKAMEGNNRFDVIFMDISMPGMDGFEATRCIRAYERYQSRSRRSGGAVGGQLPIIITGKIANNGLEQVGVSAELANESLRSDRKDAYIVALTGLGSRRDREEAENCGFDNFLTKPVSFRVIGDILTRLRLEKCDDHAAAVTLQRN